MIFASDLDNTLIHSYKKAENTDVCVEMKDGRQLSFMSLKSYELLQDLSKKIFFIPVTSRTVEQYKRIKLLENSFPRYAICCNGAILLKNGIIDEIWLKESKELLKESLLLIRSYEEKLNEIKDYVYDIRSADGFFIVFKAENKEKAIQKIRCFLNEELFDIFNVYSKIYIISKKLNKGEAIRRLKKRFKIGGYLLCAGDCTMDLPMLKQADKAVVSKLFDYNYDNFIRSLGNDFAYDILKVVECFYKGEFNEQNICTERQC